MMSVYRKRGLTLVELILSIILVSVVIMTGLSMELGMRKILASTDFVTQLDSEATSILELVTKKINQGIGVQFVPSLPNVNGTTSVGTSTVYLILQDANGDGKAQAPPTDRNVGFRYYTGSSHQYQIIYYADWRNPGSPQTLLISNRATNFSINTLPGGFARVTLSLRRFPDSAVNATNPQVDYVTSAQYRGASWS